MKLFTGDDDLVIENPPTKDEGDTYQPTNVPKERIIRKRQEYMLEGLGKIVELSVVSGKIPEGDQPVEYEGFTLIGVPHMGQIAQFPVEFAIEAGSLEEAAQNFEAAATEQFEKNMEQAKAAAEVERNKIVTARSVPNNIPHMRVTE